MHGFTPTQAETLQVLNKALVLLVQSHYQALRDTLVAKGVLTDVEIEGWWDNFMTRFENSLDEPTRRAVEQWRIDRLLRGEE